MEEKNSGGKDDRYSLQIYAALPLGGVGSPRAAALPGWQALALSRRGPPPGTGRKRTGAPACRWRGVASCQLTRIDCHPHHASGSVPLALT